MKLTPEQQTILNILDDIRYLTKETIVSSNDHVKNIKRTIDAEEVYKLLDKYEFIERGLRNE